MLHLRKRKAAISRLRLREALGKLYKNQNYVELSEAEITESLELKLCPQGEFSVFDEVIEAIECARNSTKELIAGIDKTYTSNKEIIPQDVQLKIRTFEEEQYKTIVDKYQLNLQHIEILASITKERENGWPGTYAAMRKLLS